MHLASLWNRGLGQLGNGLLKSWLYCPLAITKLLRKLGSNLPPKTVLQCTSTQHLQSWATQIKDEAVQNPKRATFPSLIWGEVGGGGHKFPIYVSKIVASCFLVQPRNCQFRQSENLLMISLQNAFGNFLCMNKQCLMLNPHRPPICNTPTEYKLSTSLNLLAPAMF